MGTTLAAQQYRITVPAPRAVHLTDFGIEQGDVRYFQSHGGRMPLNPVDAD
jgi:hypothetical protein